MTPLARIPALVSTALAAVVSSLAATDETLPPIFVAPPPTTETAAPPAPFFHTTKPLSPLSDRLRTEIVAGGLQESSNLSYHPPDTSAPQTTPPVAADNAEVITMDRFIVRAAKAPVVLRPVGRPRPFLDGLKTGKLYHSVGKTFTADISLWSSNMGSPTSDSPANGSRLTPTIPRIELAIRFSW